MSAAARIVSDTLLGTYYKPVRLGRVWFRLYQPTIRDLCRMFNGSGLSIGQGVNYLELIATMPACLDQVCRAVAVAVTIRWPWLEWLAYGYIRRFSTIDQLQGAALALGEVIRGEEIFSRCTIDIPAERDDDDTTQVLGNNNIGGQIVTFMEQLGLSYRQVFTELSFPLLLLMSADKSRVSYADQNKPAIKKVSGKEMFQMKSGK